MKDKKNNIIDIGIVVIIALVLGSGVMGLFNDPGKTSTFETKPAPDFNLRSLSGEVVGPKSFGGKVVVLDFWATWCDPCRKQMPALQRVENAPEMKDKLVVLSINTDDPEPGRVELVEEFIKRNELTFDVLLDNGVVSAMYSISRIPTIVVINPRGVVTYARSGVMDEARLRELIDQAAQS